jgi:hypothetical protein
MCGTQWFALASAHIAAVVDYAKDGLEEERADDDDADYCVPVEGYELGSQDSQPKRVTNNAI